MSFYNEEFTLVNSYGQRLMAIAITGFEEKDPMQVFVNTLGIARIDINWDKPIRDIWPDVLVLTARRRKLRNFLVALKSNDNYALVRDEIEALIAECDRDAEAEKSDAQGPAAKSIADFARTTLVGRRPFVNRTYLRENLESLFGDGGDRTMVVGGPPASGRSYTWVLASYVARMAGGFDTRLIDMSKFKDTQATPVDVVRMIAASFAWEDEQGDDAKPDATAQDETNGRVLWQSLVTRLSKLGPTCLVFDGLDGANLTEATVSFIAEIAAAAGNDELGKCRVVLLAFNGALPNPIVDPFVLREPPLADIPLGELKTYFESVAAEAQKSLGSDRATALAEELFGTPLPDPVPMSLISSKAADVSKAVCKLRGM